MKAISLWQPWASFMAIEAKKNETRGRLTHVRGDIVICSAKVRHRDPIPNVWHWLLHFHEKLGVYGSNSSDVFDALPFGKALCVVELYACIPAEEYKFGDLITDPLDENNITTVERDLGDYSNGRYAWLTRNCRPFKTPFPVKGRQGWFDVPDVQVAASLTPR